MFYVLAGSYAPPGATGVRRIRFEVEAA